MIDGIFQQEPNYDLVTRMLDMTVQQHKAHVSNVANQYTKDYTRIEVAKDFQSQLLALAERGDNEGVRNLDLKIEADKAAPKDENGNSVNFEQEVFGVKSNLVYNEMLTQVLSTSFQRIEMAISGHPKY